MQVIIFTLRTLLVLLLTAITQVGGIIYLGSWIIRPYLKTRITSRWKCRFIHITFFLTFYAISTFFLIPPLAKLYGLVPLPVWKTNHVQPLTIWTALLNRHYVRPELRKITLAVARQMNNKAPGTTINYLDAGFPFLNRFPLPPHLSHHDGKKLDIAFLYNDRETGRITDDNPSFIGYGASEGPQNNETNRPAQCAAQGYWQYNIISKIIPLSEGLSLDQSRTKAMVNLFIQQRDIAKILIEPHLKQRWNLRSNKVRLHGCKEVRHDDHIHIQLH